MGYKVGFVMMLFVVCIFAGCDRKEEGESPQSLRLESDIPLKVAYLNEDTFMNSYGRTFRLKYPGLNLEVIATQPLQMGTNSVVDWVRFMEQYQPDIIAVDNGIWSGLLKEDRLLSLEPFILRDQFDIEHFVLPVMEYIKQQGNGSLYGLTPYFAGYALFFNQGLFDRFDVPYPREGLSWEEVLQLAQRFPRAQQVYGYANQVQSPDSFDPFQMIRMVGEWYGLDYFAPQARQRFADNPLFRSTFEMVINAYQQGAMYNPLTDHTDAGDAGRGFVQNNLFMQGKAAMTVQTSYYMPYLSKPPEHLPPLNWQLAPAPVHPHTSRATNLYLFREFYAISAKSTLPEHGWELIKHIHSEETVKIKHVSGLFEGLSTRTAYNSSQEGRDVSVFYRWPFERSDFSRLGTEQAQLLNALAREESLLALEGHQSAAEALQAIGAKVEALSETNGAVQQQGGGN